MNVTETSTKANDKTVWNRGGPSKRGIMTPGNQSRKEVTRPTALLGSKTTRNIGTWNVRTMYESGKTAQVATEMRRYNLTILGLSETRWTEAGTQRLTSGETILYSGHEGDNAPHTAGVGIMLTEEANRALLRWEAHGPRIITASFRTKKRNIMLNVIQCYAPTNDKDEEIKERFYRELQATMDRTNRKDITILMGDLNAKVGAENMGYEEVMGKHGIGLMNDNGEMFADFCAMNNLAIGGTVFPHKRIHKATWVSPDHVTENQIDHISIGKKFRRSLLDVRVKRGADAASDHHLVTARVKLKLKGGWDAKRSNRMRFNVESLREPAVRDTFKLTLSNKYQVLQETETDDLGVEAEWEAIKTCWKNTCRETIGKKRINHKEWISKTTLKKVQERRERKEALNISRTRATKAEAQRRYTEAARQVKKSVRADKRAYVDNLAREAEEAAAKKDMRKLYNTTKILTGKYQQTSRPIKNKDGQVLTDTEEQMKRWAEHFEELLNRPAPQTPIDIPPAEAALQVNLERPSRKEIRKAITSLNAGKASGPDDIPAEAIKGDLDTSTEMMYKLLGKIWETGEIPQEWKEGYLVKLPKKGDLRDCKNYRGIMLLSVPGKILNRIILERLKEAVDKQLRDQQAGFRRDRSCTDQIATLRIIVEQSIEWNSPLFISFIDYEKAFDSVDRDILWKLLNHYGVPDKFINLIKNTYEGMTCKVIHEGRLTEGFKVKTGVRQGCLLSPFLFLIVIDWITKRTTEGRRNGIQWTPWIQLDDLDFADDLALLSHKQRQMQDKSSTLETESAPTGLGIHSGKTKLLTVNITGNTEIILGGKVLEEVDCFVYLGSIIDKQGGTDNDVKARISKARTAFLMLAKIWSSREYSIQTKIRLFNSNVKSVLLYGSETWRVTKKMMKKIQTFVNKCLRRILRIYWQQHITNQELWERAQQAPIEEEILKRKWRWIGHTLRKPSASTTRQALTWNPQGKRNRGRPKNTWQRDTLAEAKQMGFSWKELEKLAKNRIRWRSFVDGLCASRHQQGDK